MSTSVALDATAGTPGNGAMTIANIDDRPTKARAHEDESETLRTTLAAIFQHVLGESSVGDDDDFFQSGGDSIRAVNLMLEIEAATGEALPLTTIYDAPTVRTMARLIAEAARPSSSCLVLLKPGESTTPVFLVHGVGGSVMELRALASRIDTPFAVYGIQARGLDGAEAPLETVEGMARCYVEEIRRAQPSGPYFLVGFSFGGLVALELAQLLSGAGQEIGLLALLDTVTHTRHWSIRCRLASWFSALKVLTSVTVRERLGRYYADAVRDRPPREAFLFLLGRARRAARFPFNVSKLGALAHRFGDPEGAAAVPGLLTEIVLPPELQQVARAGFTAFNKYRPGFYGGEIVFVKAAAASRIPFDARLLWGKVARKLTIYQVPGDHWSLIKDEGSRLPTILSTYIRQAMGRTPPVSQEPAE